MARQILKQPNGLYAVYSTVSNSIAYYNCTVEELIELWLAGERERIEQGIRATVAEIDSGVPAYGQLTITWDEALADTKRVANAEEYEQIARDVMPAARKEAQA